MTKQSKHRPRGGLTWPGFLLRWGAAIALVFGTVNPTGHSYYHWVASWSSDQLPLKVLVGMIILAGFVLFFRATSRSLGLLGTLLTVAICACVFWLLTDLIDIETTSGPVIAWTVQFILSVVLALGMTGSFLWRRLTGQYTTTDDDEPETFE